MAKKRATGLHADRNELSRLLTKHRLERAGVKLAGGNATADADLDRLLERVRSATARKVPRTPSVPADIVRKLASG
jgi:hypothetical protein